MKNRRIRIGLILSLTVIIACVIIMKMLYVQVLANERFSRDSLHNRLQEVSVTPDRGLIYDVHGETLAISVEKGSVYITPSVIRDSQQRDQMVTDLAEALHMSENDVNKVVEYKAGDFAWLKRYAEDDEIENLKALDYLGVGFTREYQREYPKERLASHVLGFAGTDNTGLAGIEQQYNSTLQGNAGKLVVEYDNVGNIIPQSIRESIPATPGNNVYLSIDETVQYIVERELRKAQDKYDAEQIICIVMDVKTGNILSMANLPDYDPNAYGDFAPETWTNTAVSKVYEPGSTFKSVSASMYLEEDIAELDTQFNCPGYITIDGQQLNCWIFPKSHGMETLKEGIADSCNIVMAEGVLDLGKDRFYDYLDGFGMSKRTGIDLPGEASPILVEKSVAVPFDLAAESIGQGNAYTPIQILTATNAVANNGQLMKPQIISKVTDRNGEVKEEISPELVRLVISAETSAHMREALESVVTEGIGKAAAVPGYRVAGKTGTGEISEGGSYVDNQYNLSFCGFAPADDPKISCIVVVNKPKVNSDSGSVVGPIFSSIMGDVLRYYNVPTTESAETVNPPVSTGLITVPELSLPMDAEEARQALVAAGLQPTFVTSGNRLLSYLPAAGSRVAPGSEVELYALYDGQDTFTMPDFNEKTIKETELVLRSLNLVPRLEGSGLAYRQEPAAGTTVKAGDAVQIWFAGSAERDSILQAQAEAERAKQELEKEKKNKASVDDASTTNGTTQQPTGG